MPPTTAYSFGDVVPFPFTDQSASKRRPAVVVSSNRYHAQRPDVVLMAITSQVRPRLAFGETPITEWKKHGKPVAVLQSLGEDEWENLAVSTDPRFVALIERSRARYKAGTGIPLADVMRKYGVKPKPARRSRKAR